MMVSWDLPEDFIGDAPGAARGQKVPQGDAGKSTVRDTKKGADPLILVEWKMK